MIVAYNVHYTPPIKQTTPYTLQVAIHMLLIPTYNIIMLVQQCGHGVTCHVQVQKINMNTFI